MHDNDFLKWRKFDLTGPRRKPKPGNAPAAPFRRAAEKPDPRPLTFEDRLTFEDKLFLEAVGIAI